MRDHAEQCSNFKVRYRIAYRPHLKNTYMHVHNSGEGGSTPLHHELDDYLEEKGMEFDIGLIKHSDARVYINAVSYEMFIEVLLPAIIDIAHKHKYEVEYTATTGQSCGLFVLEVFE